MKIESSNVAMTSDRSYYSHFEEHQSTVITTAAKAEQLKAAVLEVSDTSRSMAEQLTSQKKEMDEQEKAQREEQEKKNLELLSEKTKKKASVGPEAKSKQQIQLEAMRRILELLNRIRKGNMSSLLGVKEALSGMKSQDGAQEAAVQPFSIGIASQGDTAGQTGTVVSSGGSKLTSNRLTWKRVTVQSAFYTEAEHTAYRAGGTVKTADGREISFGVDVEMSRAFCDKYESYLEEEYVFTDPLVINLDDNVASVSDQKFLFDLDGDGKEEKISFAGAGSGFLALDKNGDNKINDGSELFGTQSGDGFADLAKYDGDGNGWIDEADEIFNDLRIWMKDADGNDRLLTLKEANVGAIYLGKASTQYSLQNEDTHKTNAVIRSTGVYLKETGEVGTVQHIDLAV